MSIDDVIASWQIVVLSEGTPRKQRRAHGLKVARKHDLIIGRLKFARVAQGFGGPPANRIEISGQWERVGCRNTLKSWNRTEMPFDCVNEVSACFRGFPYRSNSQNLKREQAACVESESTPLQLGRKLRNISPIRSAA